MKLVKMRSSFSGRPYFSLPKAMDFIRKPFVPEVLLMRINNLIELVTLQKSLYDEIEEKKRELQMRG